MNKKTIFLALLLFIFVRVLFLDRDLPPSEITQFGEKDEQAYNFTAFNLYHYGSLSNKISDDYSITGNISFIFNNIFTYFTLMIFGNNYYGLRGGALLAAILIFLLLFRLLNLKSDSIPYKIKISVQLFFMIFMVIDFGFLIAGRNAAPTIFRSLFLMLIITYLNHLTKMPEKEKSVHYVLLGISSSFLIFFSYFTNAFIFVGIFCFVFLKGLYERNAKKMIISLFLISLGLIIGTIISNFIYICLNGEGIASSISGAFEVYGWRVNKLSGEGSKITIILSLVWYGIVKLTGLLTANLFTFNFTYLFIIFSAIGNTVYFLVKKKIFNDLQLISFSFILAFALQAFFYNPHPSKWINILFPVLLLFVYSNIILLYQYHDIVSRFYRNNNRSIFIKSTFLLMLIFILFLFRILKFKIDMERMVLIIISLIILLFSFSVVWINHKKAYMQKLKLLTVVFIVSVLPSAFLSVKYCILKPEFHYRDACIALDKLVGDKTMAGVWSDGFRLYTSANVFFPWNQIAILEIHNTRLIDIFEKKLADYTISYSTDDYFDLPRSINSFGKNFQLKKTATLYLGKGAMRKSITLYKRIDK